MDSFVAIRNSIYKVIPRKVSIGIEIGWNMISRRRSLLLHLTPWKMENLWGWMGFLVTFTRSYGTWWGMNFVLFLLGPFPIGI
jgi:hypothetical protein